MAFTKDKIKAQFGHAASGHLAPGERIVAECPVQTGANPNLAMWFGALGAMKMNLGYIVVTDRRLLLFGMSKITQKPTAMERSEPRSAFKVLTVSHRGIFRRVSLLRNGRPGSFTFIGGGRLRQSACWLPLAGQTD